MLEALACKTESEDPIHRAVCVNLAEEPIPAYGVPAAFLVILQGYCSCVSLPLPPTFVAGALPRKTGPLLSPVVLKLIFLPMSLLALGICGHCVGLASSIALISTVAFS